MTTILVTLDGCKKCEMAKGYVAEHKMQLITVTCAQDPDLCDYLESITDNNQYPKFVLEEGHHKLIVEFSKNSELLNKETQISPSISRYGVLTLEDMVNYVKSKI